jgi:hypothetical protein
MLSNATARGQVLHVRPAGSDSNSGGSWAAAKQTVQAAIDAANDGSTILIAAGTYFPSEPSGGASSTIPFDRTKTFQLGGDKNLVLIGGFNPDGSGQLNPRPLHNTSPTTFHTIFSGALGLAGERGDDALHVVTFAGATTDSRLDGVESLALWIASLEPAERVTIVTQLFAGGGA